MHALDPLAPRHIGSALSVTGLVVLMANETGRADVLALSCGCLAAALVAFALDLVRPRRRRRPARRSTAPRQVIAAWDMVPAAGPNAPRLDHPALSAPVRALSPPAPDQGPPAVGHRRALKDVRNRRITRGG